MFPIPSIMLFSSKISTDRDCRQLNTKVKTTWHQCISKMDPNGLKLICELKNTWFFIYKVYNIVNIT